MQRECAWKCHALVKLTAFPFNLSTKNDGVALLQNFACHLYNMCGEMRAKCTFKIIGNYISVCEQVIDHTIKLLLETPTPIFFPRNLEA